MLICMQASSFLRDSQTSGAMAHLLAQGLVSEGGDSLNASSTAKTTPAMDKANQELQEMSNVIEEHQIFQVRPEQQHEAEADGKEPLSSSIRTCSPPCCCTPSKSMPFQVQFLGQLSPATCCRRCVL
jgi:hypothetical protein